MALVADPDRLVFLLSGLHEAENTADRRLSLLHDNRTVHRSHRTALVLDALARLLVHRVDGPRQVFAVAIVPPSLKETLARLVISENSEVTEAVKNHTRGDSLASPKLHVPPFIRLDSDDPVQCKLADIKTAIVRHSWSKMNKWFHKASRHTAVFNVSNAILAPGAKDLDLLTSLKAEYYGWTPEVDFLADFEDLSIGLKELDELLQKPAEDFEVQRVRAALTVVHLVSSRQVCVTLGWYATDLDSSYIALFAQGSVDFDHWIDKVLSTRKDYLQLQHMITSPTLNDVLTEKIAVTSVVPGPSPANAFVTVDNLKNTLSADLPVDVSDEGFGEFLRKRFKSKKDERVMVPGRIHCECAVLVELDSI
ncbi:hypothetical protein C8T65DRAFT_742977 [Cerioporus squamosus]|nr:hypothetical protein C8T65DRAFT_742977 [Cerioporus squamosus]